MNTTKSKINFDKAGYYFIGLAAIVLSGFWNRYYSELIAGTSEHAVYFHFHGIMAFLWLATLIVQPILIRKRKFDTHRFIGKLSYVIMPLLIISILMVEHYIENMFPENETTFMNIMGGGVMELCVFYAIAIWKRHKVNIHARAMVATGITIIPPALDRLGFTYFPSPVYAVFTTLAVVCALLIILIVAERKSKRGRWVFPLYLCIYISLFFLSNAKIPVVDPAFGKWFRQLPLTTAPEIRVRDLPIPQNEIDRYIGEWKLIFRKDAIAVTYKKENQLWMRFEELESKKTIDSTRLLYQGDSKFIVDKNDEGGFVSRGPAKHLTSLNFHLKNGEAESFTPYYGFSVYGGYVERKK